MQTAPFNSPSHPRRGTHHPQRRPTAAPIPGSTVQLQDTLAAKCGPRRPCAQAGGTLIEVVVATAIIAVMATGLISSLGYGFMATELARENQRATQILLEKAEVIRLYNWDQFNYTNNFIPPSFTDVYDPQAPTNNQGIIYYGSLAVSNFPAATSYSTNIKQITITLNWTTDGSVSHSRILTTQIAKDGLQNYVY